MTVLLLILGVILFIGLVVVHEYGHFIAARRNGVDVEEFGIFFPPRLYKKRMKGGWNFTINALPLGGFVKLKGEHDSDTEKGSFGAASLWGKTQIMAAGVFMNLVTALLLLTFLALIGMPKLIDNQFTVASDTKITRSEVFIGFVEPGSPAARAGLQERDRLVSITPQGEATRTIATAEALPEVTRSNAGERVTVTYQRDGDIRTTNATLLSQEQVEASRETDMPKGYLGIAPAEFTLQRSTWSAPVVAVGLTAQITQLTFEGLGKAVGGLGSIIAGTATGNDEARRNGQTVASSQVSGPVAVYAILDSGSSLGLQYVLFIIAIVSLSLAIMNILPIPALDGGKLWMTLISRGIFKRPLSNRYEENINAAGFFLLIGLIILITIVDVRRFY